MKTVDTLLQNAQAFTQERHYENALKAYSDAFDVLIEEAAQYAKAQEKDVTDIDDLRKITPRLFEHSKTYLRQTIQTASILNSMGTLFRELGDYENAQERFQEALEYVPGNVVFDEPRTNLEEVQEFIRLQHKQIHGDE